MIGFGPTDTSNLTKSDLAFTKKNLSGLSPSNSYPIIKEVDLGNKDPFHIYKKLHPHFANCFILESLAGPKELARYTFLGFDPHMILTLDDEIFRVDGKLVARSSRPLDYLKTFLSSYPVNSKLAGYKYIGGLVGYISYDFIRYLEDLPLKTGKREFPDLHMGLFLDGLIHSFPHNKYIYFSYGRDRSDMLLEILNEKKASPTKEFNLRSLKSDTTRQDFIRMVTKAKDYILSGDIYQVVLSKKLKGHFSGDAFGVYELLREINPSPYMYHLKFGDTVILGSSPEMLVEVKNKVVSTYPIAGTRPAGTNQKERKIYSKELISDQKELAEHNMLVDLARNDLGRIAKYGSVHLPEYLKVKKFSHVQHIVSKVVGELKEGKGALDALGAMFPAGTVSGAPKVRAMEIIDELEISPRGPYAGAVGYFSLNGNLDTCIAIRTIFAKRQNIYLQAGAGIVADSVGAREWKETDHKLEAVKKALRLGDNQC